ncbi:Peptidase C2, calpain, large subunit, domain III [Kalmanozyma brasiliensis GHG001]|uniref:Peptidase C2, calpain, large subunit, domain III n=1 Tax=Kalmanozyma brasiliensis (strain GHG001) TaxID=1365824 RepID=UPI001CE8DF23|nr:Peptidase C2, calpain, large subunit, domain III [Kalmanozyma brasiliensis GHG001]EST04702.2 Peptidase C2, calpain, large subunit, domain III [Kalmanozyma brasiliensis GHG001]
MSAPITRNEWNAKLKHAQDQAQRATKAELARNFSEAFELYVRSGQLFLWLLSNFPNTSNNASLTAPRQIDGFGSSPSRAGADSTSTSPIVDGGSFGAGDGSTRERLKQMATKVMARAEKIKSLHKDLRPVDRDALSQEEQSTILVSSSLINGHRYPIWNGAPSPIQIATRSTIIDKEQPSLSPIQLRKRTVYQRASQINANDDQSWSTSLKGSDIVQDIVTDCSFVAALEVAAEHDRIFGGKLATSALYPKDSSGRIEPSSDGQYHAKLHINGTPRQVSIDDHLPYYPSEASSSSPTASNSAVHPYRLMCATSRSGKAIWPALLEKAYLKVMGGYDFAGSNSSIDLYALTGWLPEHIFLRHAGFQREKSWQRIHDAWNAGLCMATAGTGKKPCRKKEEAGSQIDDNIDNITLDSGLISSHNYAILDVRTSGNRRYVKLMNPWRTAAGIRPAFAISEEEEQRVYASSSLKEKLGGVELDAEEKEAEVPLTFTVSWDDFCSHFDSLFLNWDPEMFDKSVTVHSCWRGDPSSQSPGAPTSGSKQFDPHFRLSIALPPGQSSSAEAAASDPSAEVWVLLTRHITTTRPTQGAVTDTAEAPTEYIAIHAFEDDHHSSDSESSTTSAAPALRQAKHKGAFVDGTHVLVRLKPSALRERTPTQSKHAASPERGPQQCSFTIVVPRRSEPTSSTGTPQQNTVKDTNYTLSVFSRYPMELSELRTRLPYCETISGSWTTRTAGGNATLASFLSNPQYTLVIPANQGEVQLQLTLESADRRIPVQVLLTYPGTGTGRVTHLTEGDVVLSSGMYHHGMALCSTSQPGNSGPALRPGTYTLIASTFDAGILGDFSLRIESTRPVQLRPIPQEGAGMFHRRLTSRWTRGVNACGSPTNRAYFDNPGWRFTLDRPGLTGLVARIRVEAPRTEAVRPYVNLALFAESGGFKEVASSGSYTDLTCGASVDTRLPAGTYRLIASTYQPGTQADFTVDLYTAAKVDVVPL